MRFNIRHLLGFISSVAIGMASSAAIVRLSKGAPTADVLGEAGARRAWLLIDAGGAFVGTVCYFNFVLQTRLRNNRRPD
jgi:hypothetical protein